LYSLAIGKHASALEAKVGDAVFESLAEEERTARDELRTLYEQLRSGEIVYTRIPETGQAEWFGTGIVTAETLGGVRSTRLAREAPYNQREIESATVSTHACGDHAADPGLAFRIPGYPERHTYTIMSTNRNECVGMYLVPSTAHEHVVPLLEDAGERMENAYYAVDDAHANRASTLTALNRRRPEGTQMTVDLDNDLKHYESRFISTLTCTQYNRAEFNEATKRISEPFIGYDQERDDLIDSRLLTPGGIPKGARVKVRRAQGGRRGPLHVFTGPCALEHEHCMATCGSCLTRAELKEMKDDGAYADTFKSNRLRMRRPHSYTAAMLDALERDITLSKDFGVAWTRTKAPPLPLPGSIALGDAEGDDAEGDELELFTSPLLAMAEE